MTKNGNKVSLREVYDIVSRIEDKMDRRIDGVEKRISVMEDVGIKFDPTILVPKIYAAEQWIHDFRLTWKVILGGTIALSSVITFVLSTFLRISCLFGKCVG